MNETQYDVLLNIKTANDKLTVSKSIHYHPYEPTPYHALQILFWEYELKEDDVLVDFGCGKGRLNFFVHFFYHIRAVGIEMNEKFHREALINKEQYLKKRKKINRDIEFRCCLAEKYEISPTNNIFYFFNPFSTQIFMKVLHNIMLSVEQHSRKVDIILYYASNEYKYYLEDYTPFELIKEIPLPEYEANPYERFLIYRLR